MVWTGEPKKDEETPLKKYQRLNCEVRELMEDVRAASSAGGGGGAGASLDKVSVELEKLHCRLVQLRLEEVTGEEGGHLLSGGDIHTAQLLQRLKQYQVRTGGGMSLRECHDS